MGLVRPQSPVPLRSSVWDNLTGVLLWRPQDFQLKDKLFSRRASASPGSGVQAQSLSWKNVQREFSCDRHPAFQKQNSRMSPGF